MDKNEVDLFLTEAKTMEARRQELIRSLVNQRDAMIRDFDSQLAKLGYKIDALKRSHHKKPALADISKVSPDNVGRK